MTDEVNQRLEAWRSKVEAALIAALEPVGESEPTLLRAMQHAVQAGGKRLRPLLVLATCEAAGGVVDEALPAAVAVELLHSYSLVHDDLPAMDDAQLRRGQPCTHVLFGEAIGILAGDALQTRAFEVLTESHLPSERVVRQVAVLARAAGVAGMAGGQVLDLAAEGRDQLREQEVAQIHRLKTGALLAGSLQLGRSRPGRRTMLWSDSSPQVMPSDWRFRSKTMYWTPPPPTPCLGKLPAKMLFAARPPGRRRSDWKSRGDASRNSHRSASDNSNRWASGASLSVSWLAAPPIECRERETSG